VRALFSNYDGHLYQVQRSSDKQTRDIPLLSTGGHANSTEQDVFCYGTTCTISIIYDQTTRGNDLHVGTPGGANPRGNTPANAAAESISIGGNKVYSVYINPGEGYFHDGSRTGIATGADPEGMYMVASGKHVNNGCCFDYGNAETNRRDNGATHMNAIYFGVRCEVGGCTGGGPWVQVDLENGLYPGGSKSWNPNQRSFPDPFVTAMEKNDGRNFALRGGNAQSGGLSNLYDGALPPGYTPMHKEGGIILGTGGDDSSSSAGTFYEGAMVKGFPSDATENSVQQNIVAAGYGR
jgi:hypothetical protein